MKDQELLEQLVDLARRLEYEVRFDQGPFRDGNCRIEGRHIIVLNRASPVHRKVAALSRALSSRSLDDRFILPAVREAIEKYGNASITPEMEGAVSPE